MNSSFYDWVEGKSLQSGMYWGTTQSCQACVLHFRPPCAAFPCFPVLCFRLLCAAFPCFPVLRFRLLCAGFPCFPVLRCRIHMRRLRLLCAAFQVSACCILGVYVLRFHAFLCCISGYRVLLFTLPCAASPGLSYHASEHSSRLSQKKKP